MWHIAVLWSADVVAGLCPCTGRVGPSSASLSEGVLSLARAPSLKAYCLGFSSAGLDDVFVTAVVNVRNALDKCLERAMCDEEVRLWRSHSRVHGTQ